MNDNATGTKRITFDNSYRFRYADPKQAKIAAAEKIKGVRAYCSTYTLCKMFDSLTEESDKIDALIYYIKYRPNMVDELYSSKYVSDSQIIAACHKDKEVLLCMPYSFYKKNPTLIDYVKTFDDPLLYDFLPYELRSDPTIKKHFERSKLIYLKNGRDREGRDVDWRDENGNIIQFFELLGGYKIKNKAEYYYLVDKYIDSETSIPIFCNKYGIDEKGFRRLLDRIEEEKLEKELICNVDTVKSLSQKKYLQKMIDFSDDIASGNLSVEEYLKNHCASNHKIKLLLDANNGKNREKIMTYFFDYIKNNSDFLHMTQLCWLFGSKSVGELMNSFVSTAKEISRFTKNPDYSRTGYKCRDILNKYRPVFSRNGTKGKGKFNGVEYEINDDVIDQALAYMNSNDIFLCQYTANVICKNIALGKINFSKETQRIKEEMIEEIKQSKLKQDLLITELGSQPNIESYLKVYDQNQELINGIKKRK